MFRRIVSKIVGFCIPELKPILNHKVSLYNYVNIEENIKKSDFSKIYEPYRIINSSIGRGTYVSINSKISESSIGKFCSIGPNFISGWGLHPTDGLSTSPFFYSTLKQNGFTIAKENLFEERKPITIGNDVFIGANVTVLDGVKIGDGAVIGAGAIVSKNIPDYAIAYGNPIEIKKYRFTENQRTKLKNIAWWSFDDNQLKDVHGDFFNIDKFIEKYDKKR
jgi:virginiamycin A acetyltransferase